MAGRGGGGREEGREGGGGGDGGGSKKERRKEGREGGRKERRLGLRSMLPCFQIFDDLRRTDNEGCTYELCTQSIR
jgi:hypothetical protein